MFSVCFTPRLQKRNRYHGSWFVTCTFYLEVICDRLTNICVRHSDCQSGRPVGFHRSLCVGGGGSTYTLLSCLSVLACVRSDSVIPPCDCFRYIIFATVTPRGGRVWNPCIAVVRCPAVTGPKFSDLPVR